MYTDTINGKKYKRSEIPEGAEKSEINVKQWNSYLKEIKAEIEENVLKSVEQKKDNKYRIKLIAGILVSKLHETQLLFEKVINIGLEFGIHEKVMIGMLTQMIKKIEQKENDNLYDLHFGVLHYE